MAQKYNLPDGYKGDTYDTVQFRLSINDVAEDLTNYAIRCMFRENTKQGILVKDISIGSGITLVDAVNGLFNIDAFAMTFDAGGYFYDIEFTDGNGRIKTYLKGQLTVIQDITYE